MPRKTRTPQLDGASERLPERPPPGLTRHGRHFWKTYAPLANRLGATDADGAAFLAAAEHYALAMLAWDKIKVDGLFRLDENGVTRRHPAAQVHRDSWAAVVKTLGLFGMTPAARGFAQADDTQTLAQEFMEVARRRRAERETGEDHGDEW